MSLSLNAQKLIDTTKHEVNTKYLKYSEYVTESNVDKLLFTMKAKDYVKFTFKVKTSPSSVLSKVNLGKGQILSDINERDIVNVFGYDARLKIYVDDRHKLLIRMLYTNNPNYSVGFIYTIKYKRHK